ncbi:MAG: hypothetical protein JWR90_3337 [Marmoricola sp.]|jgi:hypothetical protein|nr:hypothetical protein [Marmoricola sp.]
MTSRARASRGPGSRSARLVAALTAAALSLTLAACGGGSGSASAKEPDSQPVAGGVKLAALWPLTGQPVNGPTPDHPVLVTKIDNTANSQPQLGLRQADLITEELVEGGMTRLAVFFYQHLPKTAGPVRSMRASDIGIVKPAHAVIVASGAAPPTLGRLKAAGVTFFQEGGPGYFRESSRRAPYNLMVEIPKLARTLKKKAVVPASYLPWGKESDFTGGQPATSVRAIFSRSHTTSWRYQGGKYHNDNSFAADGQRFVPDSLLVVRVRLGDAGYLDPAGNPVPETIYAGRGQFELFHKGQVVRGTWKKASKQTPIQLSTAAGPLKVPAGHVWVELVPNAKGGGQVISTK